MFSHIFPYFPIFSHIFPYFPILSPGSNPSVFPGASASHGLEAGLVAAPAPPLRAAMGAGVAGAETVGEGEAEGLALGVKGWGS